jgi:hypothetical protein
MVLNAILSLIFGRDRYRRLQRCGHIRSKAGSKADQSRIIGVDDRCMAAIRNKGRIKMV